MCKFEIYRSYMLVKVMHDQSFPSLHCCEHLLGLVFHCRLKLIMLKYICKLITL